MSDLLVRPRRLRFHPLLRDLVAQAPLGAPPHGKAQIFAVDIKQKTQPQK